MNQGSIGPSRATTQTLISERHPDSLYAYQSFPAARIWRDGLQASSHGDAGISKGKDYNQKGSQPAVRNGSPLRACLKTTRGAAAGDFGCGQGGEFRASPQRAVRNEPTQATDKRPAARRVFAQKAAWLRCSSVEDPPGVFSFVAPRHPAFGAKTGPFAVFKQALKANVNKVKSLGRLGAGSGHRRQRPQTDRLSSRAQMLECAGSMAPIIDGLSEQVEIVGGAWGRVGNGAG